MTDITCEMVHDALEAFDQEDVQKAEQVVTLDDEVDALDRQDVQGPPGRSRPTTPSWSSARMSLILLARSLERIADHAANICEEVVYPGQGRGHQTSDVMECPP